MKVEKPDLKTCGGERVRFTGKYCDFSFRKRKHFIDLVWILAPPLQFPSPGLHTGQGERIQAYQGSQHNFKILDVSPCLMLTSPVFDDKIKIIYKIFFITVPYRHRNTNCCHRPKNWAALGKGRKKTLQFFCSSGTLSLS